MKIVRRDSIHWKQKKGYSKKIFLDENDLGRKGALVQEVKIKAGETAKEHYHKKQIEIFYFLNTNGYWIVNGKRLTFNIGDVLVIEPFDKHIVVNNTKEDYLYVAFKYDYDPKDFYWIREKAKSDSPKIK